VKVVAILLSKWLKIAENGRKTAKNHYFGTKTAGKYLSGHLFSKFRNLLVRPVSMSHKIFIEIRENLFLAHFAVAPLYQ
jgi:hypothetical protein